MTGSDSFTETEIESGGMFAFVKSCDMAQKDRKIRNPTPRAMKTIPKAIWEWRQGSSLKQRICPIAMNTLKIVAAQKWREPVKEAFL